MSWVEEDGAREAGSPEWWEWSRWSDDLREAMTELRLDWSAHFDLDEPTVTLPQDCEACRHHVEAYEQVVGQAWEAAGEGESEAS